MNFKVVPAADISLSEQANIFNAAFAGYLVPLPQMNSAVLARFLCAQGADLCYTRFVRLAERLVGFGYINRTGNISRLAAMGTVPDARRTGAAAHLLSQLLEEAKAREDEAMVLEVFEQNQAALPLYRRYGFKEVSRLFAWRRPPRTELPEKRSGEVTPIPLLEVINTSNVFEFPSIPWQISRLAVAKVAGAHAFGNDKASVVIGDPAAQPIRVHAFFAGEERWHELRSVMAAVIRQFPKSEFLAVQIFPEQFGPAVFQPLGFAREPLNQFLMRREL